MINYNKGFIKLDPVKDARILDIFKELKKTPTVVIDYKNDRTIWGSISRKIGVKCKKLVDRENPLFYPTSTSKNHSMGFVHRPLDVNIEIIEFKKYHKILFNRKIF